MSEDNGLAGTPDSSAVERPLPPYASEIFGVYQPLLGWRSRLAKDHVDDERRRMVEQLVLAVAHDPRSQRQGDELGVLPLSVAEEPSPVLRSRTMANLEHEVNGFVQQANRLPRGNEWADLVGKEKLDRLLADVAEESDALAQAGSGVLVGGVALFPKIALSAEEFAKLGARPIEGTDLMVVPDGASAAASSLRYETAVASVLHWLSVNHPDAMTAVVAGSRPGWHKLLPFVDPLADFDPADPAVEAFLSPVGLIHLYRQYFFELETFLGPPVGHVWISPGGTVDLIEVNTRRTLTERLREFIRETTTRTEVATVDQDEVAEAVQEENQRNTELGVSASGGVNFSVAHGEASASFSMSTSHRQANETTHKHMHQQSEKLSSEIRRNFRTTFRTVTEVTDTSSRHYTIENPTDQLVNYELRRKMRRVAVQVQQLGTQMCWQVHVVDPGRDLGVAELVHMAKPEDVNPETVQAPDAPAPLQPIKETVTKIFRLTQRGTDTDYSSVYVADTRFPGELVGDEGTSMNKRLPGQQRFLLPDRGNGYVIANVEYASHMGLDHEDGASTNTVGVVEHFEFGSPLAPSELVIRLDRVEPEGFRAIQFTLDILWTAAVGQPVAAKAPTNEQRRELHAEYVQAVRERIRLAGDVPQRPASELRQEERVAVYRRLIEQLMSVGADEQLHVTAELIRAMFDVDRMLYFVAPEWWRPRRRIHQQLPPPATSSASTLLAPLSREGGMSSRQLLWDMHEQLPLDLREQLGRRAAFPAPAELTAADKVGWGGVGEANRDNYLITEDSRPARLGSSLGWLLQLDGDNHRNAFLNAAWVKAVIPIRPGREVAALKWLDHAGVEADGLDEPYNYPDEDPRFRDTNGIPKKLREVLEFLAEDVQAEAGLTTVLAADKVFEQGFDPLAGGFQEKPRADHVFDQWVEILPTDQVVALAYDPDEHR
jgi:hypothetical protein